MLGDAAAVTRLHGIDQQIVALRTKL